MLNTMRSIPAARGLIGAPIVVLVGLLVGCNIGPASSPRATGTPNPSASPTASPTPSPTPSATPGPTAGEIDHPLGGNEVVLRMETGGGFVPMEFLLTQAPQFTLYGDGTVIYQQTDRRENPFGGSMLPYLKGHMDEEGVQALLRYALGTGRLLGAREDYQNNMVADAGTTIFTLNAAGLSKTVSVYALGMDDPNLPADVADRHGFQMLADTLGRFEAMGANGELGEVTPYDPGFYRVFLIDGQGLQPQEPPIDWPWPDLTPDSFQPVAGDDFRPRANLDRDHVAKVETVPTGGRTGIFVVDAEDNLWQIGIRPLFPDELAAEGLR